MLTSFMSNENIYKSLILMGKGMAAIFIVMIIIFLVVKCLIRFTRN